MHRERRPTRFHLYRSPRLILLPLLVLTAAGCGPDDSPAGPSSVAPELATITSLPRFVQIAVGGNHTCAVTSGGLIYCWGYNGFGQLGDGTTQNHSLPVRVQGGALRFRRVTAGSYHACAETTDGKAYCWGNNSWGHNSFGELGDGTTAYRLTPTPVSGGRLYKQVSAGDTHSCALGTDDRAYCWGDNFSGQVGDGTVTRRLVPTSVAGGRRYQGLSAGGGQNCATDFASHSYCWGNNLYGELGDGTTTNRLRPVATLGGLEFERLNAGLHSCGVTAGGKAYCWGYNGFGELGDGTKTNRSRPRLVGGS
jgi:alpha-tubulin suppressor-like RCC1 family protein